MRLKTPFIGGAYKSRSINLSCQRLVNLFPEMVDTKDGKEIAGFFGVPGKTLWGTVGNGPIQAQIVVNGILYVVSGGRFYSVSSAGVGTLIGSGIGGTNVVMAASGTQIVIISDPSGWCYTINGNTFASITSAGFPSTQSVTYQDGYFICGTKNAQTFFISNINDGSTWNALNFASATEVGDYLVAPFSNHGILWLFGVQSTEFWYNSGDTFPFAKIASNTVRIGLAAVYSMATCADAVMFLGQSEQGAGIVYQGSGNTPQRVSTHAIEKAIQSYSTISDATAYSYEQEGHWFYVLSFPSANATWCYDISTGYWHERMYLNNGTEDRDRGCNHAYYAGKHLVGDWQNGNIYSLDLATYTDNGNPLKWLRSWRAMPIGQDNLGRKAFNLLQIDCDAGVGVQTGQGSDPQALLRWSDDGGVTWSNGQGQSLGAIGQYQKYVRFKRLGSGSNRAFELSGSDPVKRAFIGAQLDYE